MASQRGFAILDDALKLGFEFVAYSGSGHVRVRHITSGKIAIVPSTPSDWRSHANALSQLERIAGQKLPRDKSGSFNHRPVRAPLSLKQTDAERRVSNQVDHLISEAAGLRTEFDHLVAQPTTRATAGRARKIAARYAQIRETLSDFHRVIDPLA